MNPWKCKKYKDIYTDASVRTGIRLRFEKDVDSEIKVIFGNFVKWLRRNYTFPIRVSVYVKSADMVKLMNGQFAYGSFRYFDTYEEPYIRIPTGDYSERFLSFGKEDAIEQILSSLVHELTHYFQWVNQIEQTDRSSEWQANYYRYRMLVLYYKDI